MRFPLEFSLVVLMVFSGLVQPVTAEEGDEENAPNSILAKYDQGFRFSTKDNAYALRINGLLQVRWTYRRLRPGDSVQPGETTPTSLSAERDSISRATSAARSSPISFTPSSSRIRVSTPTIFGSSTNSPISSVSVPAATRSRTGSRC